MILVGFAGFLRFDELVELRWISMRSETDIYIVRR